MLLVDKIHVKPYFDYKGGNIVGSDFNCNDAADTAIVFMINSLFSDYKDVAHKLPSRKLTSDILHSLIKKRVSGLTEIGFVVISVLTDSNAINQKAMSLFMSPSQLSIVHPQPNDNTRSLFCIFDTVHSIL